MSWLFEGMAQARAEVIAERWRDYVPEVPGVYTVLLDDGEALLRQCGYSEVCGDRPPLLDGKLLANIGMSRRLTLRHRINHHLFGDSRVSSMRRSIAILFGPDDIMPIGDPGSFSYHFGDWEGWVTAFIMDRAEFGWRASSHPADEEASLIRQYRPLLNIQGLKREGFVQHMLNLRQDWADAATR